MTSKLTECNNYKFTRENRPMLKQLRKKGTAKKILWFVAIIIIISFGFFGTANYTNSQMGPTHAGRIFGKNITFEKFQKSLLHARNQAILRYGENFSKISQLIDLDAEAWDRLILLTEARKRRIHISDQEVVDTIQDFPFFKSNEKFDPSMYERIIRYVFRCEPRDFEEGVRETLTFGKLFEQESASINISNEDALKEYKNKNEQVQVSYVLLSPDNYKNEFTVAPEEIKSYFETHKSEFRLPPAINIQFVNIDRPGDPSPSTPKEGQDTATKAAGIYRELQGDPDLEKVAKKNNLTVAESGFFSLENPAPQNKLPFGVLQKAFDLDENKFSEPLETPNGYCIIKVKEKRDAHIPDFEEASEKVKEALLANKARDTAKEKAADYLKRIKEAFTQNPGANFSEIAKNFNLPINQTPLFSRGQYLPTVGISPEFQESALSLNDQDKISGIVDIAKGYAILHLDKYVPFDKDKFEKEKEDFLKKLADEKKSEAFTNFLGRLRAKANLEDNISKLKKTPRAAY